MTIETIVNLVVWCAIGGAYLAGVFVVARFLCKNGLHCVHGRPCDWFVSAAAWLWPLACLLVILLWLWDLPAQVGSKAEPSRNIKNGKNA